MAAVASSLISIFLSATQAPSPPFSRSRIQSHFCNSKPIYLRRNLNNRVSPTPSALANHSHCHNPHFLSRKFFVHGIPLASALDSLFVFCTSIALSLALFIADVDSASAFVVTTPRKLQSDELATVRLFQEHTPSVVYITNLAVRQDAFTLDVLEVPQGSGSGFVWDKDGHIVTNYHVIRGASDLKLSS